MRKLQTICLLIIGFSITSCSDDGNPANPKPHPQGTILFHGFASNSSYTHIFSINADGTVLRQLTSDSLNDASARWSPDGSKIVFLRLYSGIRDSANVAVMNADGSNIVRLTFDSGDANPSWSPDGSQIVYQHDDLSRLDVWVMNGDGANPHLLMSADSTNSAQDITWTPQGTLLGDDFFGLDLQRSPSSTSLHRVLELAPMNGATPRMSPDGSRIAFTWRGSTASVGPFIYSINVDGTDMKQLSNSVIRFPVWSPDGSKLAFSSSSRVWVMNADGSNPLQLTTRTAPGDDRVSDWK
jgi:Tol biopolymer transport system component